MSHRILVVDDERNIRRTFGMILQAEGFAVHDCASGEDALALLAQEDADLVILDVCLPGQDGLQILRELKRTEPERPVIMISGHATIATAVEATRQGACDFLEKPCSRERVVVAVRNALQLGRLDREVRRLKAQEESQHVLIGASAAIVALREQIGRAGPSQARILICGESGTGKELVARAVHTSSSRRQGPFVKVNCAAIPEELIESELFGAVRGAYTGATESRDGKFLQADGGTLFLDEVGDMSLRAQAKVLRVLQEGEIEKVGAGRTEKVDVRVLAATNKQLPQEVAAGKFREDLFYRLNVIPIVVPPLRQRRDDIPRLARHFLAHYGLENNLRPKTFSADVLRLLAELPWPGNVRELNNVVERLAIMSPGPEIGLAELHQAGLPPRGAAGAGGQTAIAQGLAPPSADQILSQGGLVAARRRFEVACIRACLEAAQGNVSQAARLLGIDRTNLHKKIQSYGLAADGRQPEPGGRR